MGSRSRSSRPHRAQHSGECFGVNPAGHANSGTINVNLNPWRGGHCHGWWPHRSRSSRPRYLGNDRHKRRTSHIATTTCVYLRCQLPAPREYLLTADLPAPCYLRHNSTRNQRFSNNARLLIRRPASPPIRTRQHLNTPINTLSVVFNVVHNSVSKPSLASKRRITFRINGDEGPASIAYG